MPVIDPAADPRTRDSYAKQERALEARARAEAPEPEAGAPPAPPASDRAFSLAELVATPPDPEQTLLGNRFLCRTGSMLFVGPSGIGKSSASMLMDVSWSCGRDAFGIAPARPLRVLCVQAENDTGDLHEMASGALESIELSSDEMALVESNFRIIRHQTSTGNLFLGWLEKQIVKLSPDLVRMDPMLAYFGDDPTDTKAIALFCRAGLNPILEKHDCGAIINHHTPKTNYRDTADWKPHDWMYAGAGGADLTNWARAILVVDPTDDPRTFRFIAAKRGRRVGWLDDEGNPVQERFFSHACEQGRIAWEDTPRDVAEDLTPKRKTSLPSEAEFIALLPAVDFKAPETCLVTMSELELRAQTKRIGKTGLAGLRDQLEREGKIYVRREGGKARAIRIGRAEIASYLPITEDKKEAI